MARGLCSPGDGQARASSGGATVSVRSSPAIADGIVYVVSYDGNLYAMNSQNGQLMWKFRVGEEVDAGAVGEQEFESLSHLGWQLVLRSNRFMRHRGPLRVGEDGDLLASLAFQPLEIAAYPSSDIACTARRIAAAVPGSTCFGHPHGCDFQGADADLFGTFLERFATHPNVGGVLLVSLGCEGFKREALVESIQASGRPVETLVIQQAGGTRSSIDAVQST